jgi:uncharacterized protein
MAPEIKCLVLLVTLDCNLRCRYCYARGGERKDYMTWETARRAVDYVAARSRSFKVQFTGGEPLLHLPLVERVIEYLKDHPGRVTFQLQTNATLIDRALARELKRLGVGLGVSLDGPPGVNDYLRPFADGGGSTAAVIRGLESLAVQGLKVGLTAVLTGESMRSLPRLVELASYLGNVHGISLDLFRPLGRGANGWAAAPEPDQLEWAVKAALDRAEELARLGGPQVRFREVERLLWLRSRGEAKSCYCLAASGQSLAVTPDGSVYPCASLCGQEEFLLGNVHHPGFSSAVVLPSARLALRPDLPPKCRGCPQRDFCGGGCLARAYAYNGSLDRPYDGECRLKQAIWRWALARGQGPTQGSNKS